MGHDSYDLAIIGSGPAGVSAAVQAAKLGKRVCVIEKDFESIGGAWIQTGTLPSKTLREVLAMTNSVRAQSGSQWSERIVQDMLAGRLFERARQAAQRQEEHVRRYLAKNGVELIAGEGALKDAQSLTVQREKNTRVITAKRILIATGSRPRRPESVPFDGWRVIDSDEVLRLEQAPRKILIYGAGVIGCEYACIFAALGVETLIADSRPNIMPGIDLEVAAELRDAMQEMGVQFLLERELHTIKTDGVEVEVKLNDETHKTDVFFFAAGRIANSDRINASAAGVKCDARGLIVVNADFQSSVPSIYAAGDIIGAPALAATSSHQGRVAASNAFDMHGLSFPRNYPIGVYTIPELSSVGETEEQLIATGREYVVGRAGYSEIARGYIRGDSYGKLKLLVCRRTHKLIGLHIVGEGACELIHIGMVFMEKNCTAQDLLHVVYNYPTLAEGYKIAAFNALNKIFPSGIIGDPPTEK